MLNRRAFLQATAAAAALARMPHVVAAKYDLLVKGGKVIDPSQRIYRAADVAISGGRIAAVRPDIAASAAADAIDARGKLVTPGLIDIHSHATEQIPKFCLSTGVTTAVDAGRKGADNIADVLSECGRDRWRAPPSDDNGAQRPSRLLAL